MEIKELTPSDGAFLQAVRLRALHDCPEAFGSSYEEECHWDRSVYGEESHSLKMDGRYYDEFYMMKKLV